MQRRSRSDGGAVPGARARALASRLPEAGAALVRVPAIVARSLVAPLTTGDTEAHAVHGGARRGIDIWLLLDAVLAVVLYTVTAVSFVSANEALASPYPPQLMHLLAGGCCLPVALRRRRPVIAWQIAWASTVVTSGWFTALFTDAQFVPGQVIAYLLCLYTLQSRASSPLALGAWLWSLAGIVVIATADPSTAPANAPLWAWAVALVTASLPFGYNMRTLRRAQADLREQRARNEREQAARAVLEERSRIARELHDVVAHNMSVIAIQAEAAPLRARGDAAALAEDLAGIRATALETLTEMRRVLGVLRDREGAADHAPAPGIEQIADLVEKVGAAGPDVRLEVTGTARPVAPGVGVSVYRIVQESVSNALRHAPGAAVTVRLAYGDAPAALHVRVENGPARSAPPPDGWAGARHGLVGMRERAAMLQGGLSAEPTPDGGFAVDATLPLEGP